MSDLEKIKSVLENQQRKGVRSGNWQDLTDFRESVDDFPEGGESITIHLDTVKVGICFTLKGKLIGIYNWQS